MRRIACSQCGKQLVQNKKNERNLEIVLIFNKKQTAMCCNELLTWGPVVYRFCICYDCKHKLCEDKGKESEGR